MIPIIDNVSLVLCDKPVVKKGEGVSPLEYETTSVTTPSVSTSIETHQTDVYDEIEAAISISRTNPCTYSSTMLVTVQKSDAIVLVLQARKSEKNKTIAIIAHKARKTQYKSHRLGLRFLYKSNVHNNKGAIVFNLTKINNIESTFNITFDANKVNMLGVARMTERCLWESEQLIDPDEASLLSPPVIHATNDLLSFKNGYNFFMGLSPAFATHPVSTKIVGDLDGEEEEASVLSENIRAFLEQIGKPEVSDDDHKKKENQISATIDTRDCTEDHYTTLPDTHQDNGGWKDFPVQEESGEDDDSSIASSSSSAVFELFDDVSVLTDEDSRIDRDINEFNVQLQFFEELSLMTTDILDQEENDRCVIYYSPGWQGADMDLVEEDDKHQDSAMMQLSEQWNVRDEQFYFPHEQLYVSNDQLYIISDQYSITDDEWSIDDEWFVEDEDSLYEESKEDESGQVELLLPLEFLAGARNEEGFSASDELQMA